MNLTHVKRIAAAPARAGAHATEEIEDREDTESIDTAMILAVDGGTKGQGQEVVVDDTALTVEIIKDAVIVSRSTTMVARTMSSLLPQRPRHSTADGRGRRIVCWNEKRRD